MRRRKSLLGIAMLCSFAACALTAQSAMAAFSTATNTTAFTCASKAGADDFSDAHCDKSVTAGTGSFGHVAIANGTNTETVLTNAKTKSSTTESTPAVFTLTLGGVPIKFTATTVTGAGTTENSEPKAKEHHVRGTSELKLTGITVNNPANCKINEPIEVSTKFTGVAEGESTGVLFESAVAGQPLTSFVFENNGGACSLNGLTWKVTGTAIATGGTGPKAKGSGATTVLEPSNGMESLKVGETVATLTTTLTRRRAPVGGVEQNPIALTKVT